MHAARVSRNYAPRPRPPDGGDVVAGARRSERARNSTSPQRRGSPARADSRFHQRTSEVLELPGLEARERTLLATRTALEPVAEAQAHERGLEVADAEMRGRRQLGESLELPG